MDALTDCYVVRMSFNLAEKVWQRPSGIWVMRFSLGRQHLPVTAIRLVFNAGMEWELIADTGAPFVAICCNKSPRPVIIYLVVVILRKRRAVDADR